MKIYPVLVLVALVFVVHSVCAQEEIADPEAASSEVEAVPSKPSPPMDIVVVLDNSGSMRKNDPAFLTREVVSNFLNVLSQDSRIGFVVFAEKPQLTMPLTPVSEDGIKQKVTETMAKVDYRGLYTDTPAAIESAIYELTKHPREDMRDANKLIIFMTDGIVDTGDRARDIERQKWLENQLADESKAAGIRIFGIAFTEKADFQLIQTLGQKTGGDYYRAYKAEDIQIVFSSINEAISRPEPEPEPVQQQQTKEEPGKKEPPEKGFPVELLMVAIVGLLVLGIVAVVFIFMRRGKGGVAGQDVVIPEACLMDLSGVTGAKTHKIDKRIITIGRVNGDGVDISIDRDTVSAVHAQIEYRDNGFYLTDLGSLNGTYMNDSQERISSEVRLKGGDVISFHQHSFKFAVPGQGERGGTLDQLSGGTVLDIPGVSEPFSPQPEDQDAPSAVSSQDDPGDGMDTPPPDSPEDEESQEDGTKLKPGMCPKHPSYRATELCPVCEEARCKMCMVEKDGRMICAECAAKEEGE